MAKKYAKAKKKAWDAFAKWVRIRDCLATTGLPFVGHCITCGRRFHIDALDAGHYNSGRRNSVLFQEKGVHAQCRWWCNHHKNGDLKKYRKILIKKYGLNVVEELEAVKNEVIRDIDMDFEGIEKKYKQKLLELQKKHKF